MNDEALWQNNSTQNPDMMNSSLHIRILYFLKKTPQLLFISSQELVRLLFESGVFFSARKVGTATPSVECNTPGSPTFAHWYTCTYSKYTINRKIFGVEIFSNGLLVSEN